MGIGIAVITFGKIAVKRCYNGILALGVITVSGPLTNTRPTGIGQDHTANFLKHIQIAIPFHGVANLFTPRCYGKVTFDLELFMNSLFGNGCRPRNILIGRIGAGTDKTNFDLGGPAVGFSCCCHLRNGCSSIGCKRSV